MTNTWPYDPAKELPLGLDFGSRGPLSVLIVMTLVIGHKPPGVVAAPLVAVSHLSLPTLTP